MTSSSRIGEAMRNIRAYMANIRDAAVEAWFEGLCDYVDQVISWMKDFLTPGHFNSQN